MNARLTHFASRDAMNIEGMSEKTIGQMIEKLSIKQIDQIYDISKEDLLKLEGFKDRKANNILEAIESSKNPKLSSFIYSLGIPNVGIKTAEDLSRAFKTLDKIRNAKYEELIQVEDVGEITAKSIIEFFHEDHIVASLDKLLSKDIKIQEEQEEISSELDGLTIVVTGTIEGYNRKEIEEKLKLMGAKVSSSVSKNTDILLAGEKAGSKLTKAQEFETKIYQDEELYDFIRNLG